MSTPKHINPFYVVLVVAGTLFCITACAYGVMAFRAIRPEIAIAGGTEPHPLMTWVDTHGFSVMMVEIGVIAIATFAAIGTDEFWARRRATNGE